ncbi:unnamed protein product, partial [Mesorhabditis belari]|uniref:Piwi domain-containing protein n=1 Tax=Mesorhabditis belari TaxID=2138241 RepID=A0AAF3FMN6_9BILA
MLSRLQAIKLPSPASSSQRIIAPVSSAPKSTQVTEPTSRTLILGCVVDTILTSPKFKQFYLNSHIALQGSALTPLYTILCDDCKWSMDDIEEFTYGLCYMHQIEALPTSLPNATLCCQSLRAERGRRMRWFNIYFRKNEAAAGVESSHTNFLG